MDNINENNPFFHKYTTPHETVPFDKIKLEHFEPAFIEGIRRDDEHIEKIINNPEPPTFDNTLDSRPVLPLNPINPDNARTFRITAAAGTELAGPYSQGTCNE